MLDRLVRSPLWNRRFRIPEAKKKADVLDRPDRAFEHVGLLFK